MPLNTKLEPQSWDGEVVLGIMTGELRLEVEGHDMTVKSGDCVVVPLGVELGQEVIGTRPVLKFTANKLK
jgi:mannose-6-phosphate isomerase-like protein (cupin superfamily)